MVHETIDLLDPFSNTHVPVDTGMVPLIKNLWGAGIPTVGCCQGFHPGEVDEFPDGCWGYVYFHESLLVVRPALKIVEDFDVSNLVVSHSRTDGRWAEPAQRRGNNFYRWHIRFDAL